MDEKSVNESTNRVRIVSSSAGFALEQMINSILDEEQSKGAELVDIKLTAVPGGDSMTSQNEFVAIIVLRSAD